MKLFRLLLLHCLLVVSHLAFAAESEPANQESPVEENQQAVIIDYTVQTGDTLSSLSEAYLGDAALWRLNAEINPDLNNVNFLKPGSQIRLITGYSEPEPEVIASQATIILKSNQVNKSLQGGDWSDAEQGEDIFSGDGLRTLRESSALLQFTSQDKQEETDQVQVYENSVVFLREESIENSKATRKEIEIEKGSAQIELSNLNQTDENSLTQYEVNVGGVITVPSLGADGKSSTKARLDENATSQIMVYDGNSTVESAGVSVAVEKGMGTVAKAGEAPAEPERLLTAPNILENEKTAEINTAITLKWEALEGANHYRLDLCSDAPCNLLIRSITDINQTSQDISHSKVEEIFWRITAISPSGLDGFPSPGQALNIYEPIPEPPTKTKPSLTIPQFIALSLGTFLFCHFLILFLAGVKNPIRKFYEEYLRY